MDLETLTLKEFFKKSIRYSPDNLVTHLTEAFDVRFCDFCGKALLKGIYYDSLYWCERCIHNILLSDHPEDECGEWGDEDTKKIVAIYNEALDELRRKE